VTYRTLGRRFEALVWFGMAASPLSREEDQDAGGDLLHKRKQQAAKPSLALAAVLYDTDCRLPAGIQVTFTFQVDAISLIR
jgi:hypothetical protein